MEGFDHPSDLSAIKFEQNLLLQFLQRASIPTPAETGCVDVLDQLRDKRKNSAEVSLLPYLIPDGKTFLAQAQTDDLVGLAVE
ncbi:hypothetical protein HMH05_27130 [Pseudomonas sp. SbB1]|uniref:hypothetical protein n=1 Tax=Pseudomonas TaxID=286 RepID=UPI00149283BF|nr:MULTISPECIES: hypothetical protein [Pseudomonas]MBP0711629.1 hypothetical protein [Pseudomonas sp. T34]MCK2191086.1 hypothetical protein [Pseudomonas sp. MB04B]MDD2088489.1 hypothetical protein [Pseudomonas putida]MDD2098463.1 hypothetical protein [Pseudomonas putida]NOG91470.1 hypothetical protein [Pseudomonas sp. SbB1]